MLVIICCLGRGENLCGVSGEAFGLRNAAALGKSAPKTQSEKATGECWVGDAWHLEFRRLGCRCWHWRPFWVSTWNFSCVWPDVGEGCQAVANGKGQLEDCKGRRLRKVGRSQSWKIESSMCLGCGKFGCKASNFIQLSLCKLSRRVKLLASGFKASGPGC